VGIERTPWPFSIKIQRNLSVGRSRVTLPSAEGDCVDLAGLAQEGRGC
jgi:hypothetical protein